MKKYILLAFLIILSSLLGCAILANPDKPQQTNEQIQITPIVGVATEANTEELTITNSDMPNKTDTEYEHLLSLYNGILLQYNETEISKFSDLDTEAMVKFQTLLNYRESLAENYQGGYEICFEVPRTSGIRISFSEIYKTNVDNYRYVTYIPIGTISKVFIQVWNDDIFESAVLLTVLQSPRAKFEVVDTRILSDDSGVYANLLIKATDYSRYEHSYEMYTYVNADLN